ncbi:GNAT family N-acetyltransferase [Devosia sediminis]|uniref:GNAT family N-acetyltransferase n=1 Tax=Devosia sediminis TaxID=2798801 RepID=A0A934IZ51_9HYPH|nr:GNAT family N-acetyltransferase [Devosia sediminis]MBJ3785770.1 GNAT family N-acetyltransferase [Devosia sediminis]
MHPQDEREPVAADIAAGVGCQLLVGAAVVWHHKGASTSRLSWIGVDPAARRRGVGSLLLESVMARASLGGAHDVSASVPEAAEGLGELLGARDFAAGKGGEWRLSLGG